MTDALTPAQCLQVLAVVEQAWLQTQCLLPDQSCAEQRRVGAALCVLRGRLWDLEREAIRAVSRAAASEEETGR